MKHYRLSNGIPVIIDRMSGTNVVTALILFKVGSRHENPKNNGISHFIEHLFFKGTEKRRTTLEISRELDGVGADFNAFTSKDYTGYYVKVASQHTPLAIDILEDILFHPIFDPEEIDRERGVIVEEINMYEDKPMVTAEELAEMSIFGKNHPLGYRIAGPRKNIRSISREEIIRYRDEYYHTNNMVVILAGNVPADAERILKKQFARAPKPRVTMSGYKKFSYTQSSSRVTVETKPTAQSHLALSFPGPTYTQKDSAAYQVLSTILGASMSSRLFIQVRERQGLCYYIYSGISPYEDMGVFTIQAGFDTKRINQAIIGIVTELKHIRDAIVPITEHELRNAKEYIAGKMSLRLEDSEHVASWWGRGALFVKECLSPEEAVKRIRKVTIADLYRVAKKTFNPKHANLVVVGPYKKTQAASFKKLIHF
ncbi:MAG: insulinase family protein [Candidatus Kerfeldbacteria bacterium]|nr:insulinase family protein [Candidatus Kerfeldbacteria bacterium]